MPAHPAEAVDFTLADRQRLLDRMRSFAETRQGWVNLRPVPDDDDGEGQTLPQNRAGVFALFSGRGPSLPVATWVPGEVTREGVEPDSIGLQHAAGPKARFRLADAGVPVPYGWKLLADHPRRGLVVELPSGTSADDALDWLLRATVALAQEPVPERWVALVYQRS